jgi:hypothetical protein
MGQAAQEAIIRIEALCGFVFRPFDFGLIELGCNCTDHLGRNLILKLEDVLQCFVESVGPDMSAISLSMSWLVMRTLVAAFRTLPSST